MLGSAQNAIASALELDLRDFGLLGSALSLGIGIGVLVAGPAVDRFSRRPLFLASTLVAAFALLSVRDQTTFAQLTGSIVLLGFAAGAYDTLLNAVCVERYQDRSVRRVSALHASVTIGAMAAPPVIGWLTASSGWARPFQLLGATYVLLSLVVACVPLPRPTRAAPPNSPPRRFMTPVLVALCVVGFAYVGVEAALTLFAVPYAGEGLGLTPERGRAAISSFWLGILIARVALSLTPGSAGARYLIGAGLIGTLVLVAGPWFEWNAVEVFAGSAGLALGGVFPLMITLAGQHVPHARGAAMGVVAGLGSLGGFAVPWLTGAIGDRVGILFAVGSLALWSLCIAAAAASIAADRDPSPHKTA